MAVYSDIVKTDSASISGTTETTLANLTYTVSSGKNLFLTNWACGATSSIVVVFRFKINGITKLVMTDDGDTNSFDFSKPVLIATSGQVITVTAQNISSTTQDVLSNWIGYEE